MAILLGLFFYFLLVLYMLSLVGATRRAQERALCRFLKAQEPAAEPLEGKRSTDPSLPAM
ncbi:MAG: hypothetical protein AAEJ52_01240 [Myxococcota bacterium]